MGRLLLRLAALLAVVLPSLGPLSSDSVSPAFAQSCVPSVGDRAEVIEGSASAAAMRVTLTGRAQISGGDQIRAVAFSSATNAVVETADGRRSPPFSVAVDPPAPEWSFVIRRLDLSKPFIVSYQVTDRCGVISRFSGAGTGSSAPPAPTATPPSNPSNPSNRPPVAPTDSGYFPLGMFEDNNVVAGDKGRFATMIDDLRAHNLDSVLFTNSSVRFHAGLLDVSDQKGFNVVFAPMNELNSQWFYNPSAPTTIEAARSVVRPLADQLKDHPSLRGYNILDDATNDKSAKDALAIQAFWEADPNHPAMPVIVGEHEQVYRDGSPWSFLTYSYPAKAIKEPCDWGFVSPTGNAFSLAIRSVARDRDPRTPLWLILQAHGATASTDPGADPTRLRTPTIEEARLQQWIALGEGAKGIFWFIYSTEEFWTGLKDNPSLYAEVGDLARRIAPLRPTLTGLHKATDRFDVNGSGARYVSTLATADDARHYVVAANASCHETQPLTITSTSVRGQLRDLETGQVFELGAPIPFRPGDGRLFEVINASVDPLPAPTPSPNLVANPSFEQAVGNRPTGWSGPETAVVDTATARSGATSLRIDGPSPLAYVHQMLNLKPVTQYTVSYWVRTQNAGGTNQGIGARFAQLTASSRVTNFPWTNGTTERRVATTFFTGLDLVLGRLDVQWSLPPGGTAWIDDVVVCEGRACAP
jgi:hypothetical protein